MAREFHFDRAWQGKSNQFSAYVMKKINQKCTYELKIVNESNNQYSHCIITSVEFRLCPSPELPDNYSIL